MDQMRQFFKRDKNLDVRRTNRFAFNRNKRHYLKDTCHFTIKPKFKWSISKNPAQGLLSGPVDPTSGSNGSKFFLVVRNAYFSQDIKKLELAGDSSVIKFLHGGVLWKF